MEKCLSVIMPVYNEEATIDVIVDRVKSRPEVAEIIIVDDASTDSTAKKLKSIGSAENIKVIFHKYNQGKGAAVRRGIEEAASDFVIIQDADFEYDPADYHKLLEPLVTGKAHVVYGSRFMHTPGPVRYFRHEMGNKVLTFFSNCFSDIHLTDMETCYKAFRREVIQNLILTSNRFGIEVEITAKIAKARCLRIYEVPISYNPRRYDEGKKIGWKDGVAAFYHILKFNVFTSPKDSFKNDWEKILNTH